MAHLLMLDPSNFWFREHSLILQFAGNSLHSAVVLMRHEQISCLTWQWSHCHSRRLWSWCWSSFLDSFVYQFFKCTKPHQHYTARYGQTPRCIVTEFSQESIRLLLYFKVIHSAFLSHLAYKVLRCWDRDWWTKREKWAMINGNNVCTFTSLHWMKHAWFRLVCP